MAITLRDPTIHPPEGGGKPRITVETASLASPEYLQIVELLSEGEIEGLVNDGSDASAKLKSIYLDGTPIRNQDGSYNFSGIAWAETTGTHTQAPIPGFVGVQADVPVNADLTYNIPVIRTITDTSLDSVVVTISVSALYKMDVNEDGETDDDHPGDMIGTTLPLKIELQSSGGSYVEQTYPDNTTIGGKCTKTYERQYPVRLTGSAPWNIRVTKLVADETDPTKAANAVAWHSYTTVIDDPQSYPDCATVALEIPASLFSNVPRISHLVKGIKIQVPTNYDPIARTYSGVWDGTFKKAWSDNPAWCFYDILTNARYGLGEHLDTSNVDKWGLYEIGQYCDELVDDGNGGMEPRFTCNLLLGVQNNAYDVIKDFASIFRAMTYWASGSVQVTQDKPADPEYLFTPANVVDGLFTYASSAKRSRHTVAIVTWNDPANHYSSTKEYVEDADGIALYGYNPVELGAFGCTSQGQAHRLGQWMLFTERLETESVSFQTGFEGAMRSPGSVIAIQDPNRSGIRFGGRVVSATTTSLTLDAPVTIESGKTYSVSVILPDGSLADAPVGNSPGSTSTLSLATTLSAAPVADASWILTASDLSPELFRIIGISENSPNTYTISALKHIPGKYALIEQGIEIVPARTSIIPSTLAPTGLVVSESLYKATTGIKVRLQASWDSNPSASKYVLQWRRANDSWSQPLELTSHLWEALDVTPGPYQVQVQYVIGGVYTDPVAASYTVLGKTAPPADVSGLVASVNPLDTTISWSPVADVDLDHYEIRTGSATWDAATFYATQSATSFTFSGSGFQRISVKAVDTSGNYSVNPAIVTFTQDAQITGSNIANGSIGSNALIQPPSDNLVPNGYSEAGSSAIGKVPDGSYLVNDPANAYEGNWCRTGFSQVAGVFPWFYTSFIPCVPDEEFFGSLVAKGAVSFTNPGAIAVYYYDKDQAFLSADTEDMGYGGLGTSYRQYKLATKAPANACYLKLAWQMEYGSTDVNKHFFVDAIQLRKMVTFDLVVADTFKTPNYLEYGQAGAPAVDADHPAGTPYAGAKLDNVGTSLKVASDNLQVGPYTLTDAFFRAANGIDGDSDSYLVWRGNIDTDSGDVLPNVECLTVQPNYNIGSGPYMTHWTFYIQPTSLTDNLDGLRMMRVIPYHGDSTGAVVATVQYIQLNQRGYANPTHSSPDNSIRFGWDLWEAYQAEGAGIAGPLWYLKIALYNQYGRSEERWFAPPTSYGNFCTRIDDGSSPFSGAPPSDGGGGLDGGIGGYCPADGEPIMLADGSEVKAEHLGPGQWVITQDEKTLAWGRYLVQAVKRSWAKELVRVTLKDGRSLLNSKGHRFYVRGHGWIRNDELTPGATLEGGMPGIVAQVEAAGSGWVTRISVDGAQTFLQRAILSHNRKIP